VLLEESRDQLDPILVGRAASLKAHIARFKGQSTEMVAHHRWAAKHFKSIGHRRAACEALENLGLSLLEVGQIESAEDCLREALVTARMLDLGYLLCGGLQMLANILAYKGDLAEARTVGKQALEVKRAQKDQRIRGSTEAYLSVIEYLAGGYVRAEHYARAALATLAAVLSYRPFAMALLARSLLAQDRLSEALPFARDAFAQLESMVVVDDGEATIRLALAECLVATGDQPAAQQAVSTTAQWLRTRAETIDDPAMRESFLTRIPEHRRILDLARALGLAVE
jgi:tetratricopeptide (TPR) repeat protein